MRSQRGYIMVMALLVAALALSLGSAAVSKAATGARLTHQSAEWTQAYYLAQAGVEDVANRVATSYAYPVGTSTYGPFNLGAGSYTVQVTYDGANGYNLLSTGTVARTTRTIRATGNGYGFNSVIYVFGSSTTANWKSVDLNGTLVNGTPYPAQVYHNGSLTINKGNLGGFINGVEVDANLYVDNTLNLGGQRWSKAPNCNVSGAPFSKGGVILYGTGTGCWTGSAYKTTDYVALKNLTKVQGAVTTTCPFQSINPLILKQPQNPNPYNNYVYFIDCSGYSGPGRKVEIGTDPNGLAGSYTLVIYGKGNKNLQGLIVDDFIAQPGANLGIISDIPNQTITGSTIQAFMRFDAKTGHAVFQNNSVVTGAITAYDIDTGSGQQVFNVQTIVSGVPPGFSTFTFSSWTN